MADRYQDLTTVESSRNDLTAEEFPEGPYGMSLEVEQIGKSSPWRAGQSAANPFGYENVALHDDMERAYPPDREVETEG